MAACRHLAAGGSGAAGPSLHRGLIDLHKARADPPPPNMAAGQLGGVQPHTNRCALLHMSRRCAAGSAGGRAGRHATGADRGLRRALCRGPSDLGASRQNLVRLLSSHVAAAVLQQSRGARERFKRTCGVTIHHPPTRHPPPPQLALSAVPLATAAQYSVSRHALCCWARPPTLTLNPKNPKPALPFPQLLRCVLQLPQLTLAHIHAVSGHLRLAELLE